MARMALPRIPGYELHACLGGGMLTSVYAARQAASDTACAVKLLRPDWAEHPVAIKLLQREARACLTVRHRHLVELLEAHVTRAPYFLVMPLLPGESLRRRLRRDYQLDLATGLWITRQIADALAALHRKGFVHGDVKPDNIRILEEGRAILLDLGFAHRPGENTALLQEGYVLGTPNYLAPELCGAEPKDEPRNDLFSLGVTLFEILTGQVPCAPACQRDTLRPRRAATPLDLASRLPDAPATLVEVMHRLLADDPGQRPSALELVHQLVGLEIGALRRRAA